MICQSCGANSKDATTCEYCGTKIVLVDVSDVLLEEETKKAKILNLSGDLSYVFSNKDDQDQIIDRILEKSKEYIDNGELKKAEFFSKVGLNQSKDNEKIILLSAQVNALYGLKVSGSIQMANIKQKYLYDAKEQIEKVSSDSLKDEKDKLLSMISQMDGKKASQFDAPGTMSSQGAGCFTIVGWIVGLIVGGFLLIGFIIMEIESF